jgi:acetyl-CoA acetyltransferase
VSAPATLRPAAIAGVGYSPFTKASGRSVLDQALEASRGAIVDAGLEAGEVDGIASFMLMHDSVPAQAVATGLALPGLRWSVDAQLGGQAPCYLVGLAASAIATGQVDAVLVFRALNGRSGARVGTMHFAGMGAQYRYPIGYDAYLMYVAMWARRFLLETGQGEEDLGAVALAQRAYAADNDRAYKRRPLTRDEYLASPFVVEPFRADDCTIEVDGACAVLVTSLERARDLRHPPAVVASAAYHAGARSGLDIGDHLLWDDYSRNYTSWLRDELYARAGLGPADVQLAEIYDCFTSTVLMGLEGLGLCERGESGALARSGATAPGGPFPVNTHGGLLAEGYLHGMNTVAEAALQVQGRGGVRQAIHHEVCAVTSGALMDGSALVLTIDR